MASIAQTSDFLGTGADLSGGTGVRAPYKSPEQLRKEEERRIYALYLQGKDANGNQLPAYGTPKSQGGTASGYQVTHQTNTHTVGGGSNDVRQTAPVHTITPGDFNDKGQFEAGLNTAGAPGAGAVSNVQGDRAVAEGLADQVLGAQPSVDPNNKLTQENISRLTPVIDPSLGRNAEIDRAFAMSEDLVNRIMNAPSQTQQIADRSLSNQLALGRSAPGGIGAVQAGVKSAMGQAPQLQAQATQASIQEQQARADAATGAAQIYAGVAAGTADRDVKIAEANQSAAVSVIQNLTTLTGFDYQFDQAKMGAIGQLTRDFFQNAQAYAEMESDEQIVKWQEATKAYGIDKQFQSAIEKIAADEGIGPFEAFKMVLGGAAAVGGLVAGGPAGAALAGAGASMI